MQEPVSEAAKPSRRKEGPSLMVRNFRLGNYYKVPPPGPLPFYRAPYFLYGDLLDPGVLMRVLGLDAPPALRPGISIGLHFEDWQGRPALLRGPAGNVVHGAVSDGVVNEEMERRLEAHMTAFFRKSECFVRFDQSFVADGINDFFFDGASIVAKVFILLQEDISYDENGVPSIIMYPWRVR